ncbi:hypothetical protein [Paenibacillus elgii]|uniref:hypothetical protein n=1 Tax=Paenibacillus elgii TaxID=189691 RepID=UPI000248D265|nr:hypothetical protein [Paenibacillus elgii]
MYRVSDFGEKLFEVDNAIIFCSGTMPIAYEVIEHYEATGNFSINHLKESAETIFNKYQSVFDNPSLELIYVKKIYTKIVNAQISSYNNFKIIYHNVDEGVGVFTGGIKTEESLNYLVDKISTGEVNVKTLFSNLFNSIAFEGTGGFLKLYEVKDKPKLILHKKIEDCHVERLFASSKECNLIIAEQVLGKLILGERVTIGDPDGVWLTEGPKTTITDRCGREVMKLGLYDKNPDKFGMIVNRYASDDCSSKQVINQFIVNGNDGIKITQWNGKDFKDKFYADTNGLLMAEDMTTKRLKILSDTNELMLDSFTKYMDIGKFDNIITDGKLTAIEKLQVKGERERIISEYQKLLAQAEIYKSTSRDNTIRIDPTSFTNRYNELIAYLNPLLSNMDETTVIDRNEFIQKFKRYYDEVTNIVNAINDSIKYSSLQLGTFYNDMVLDAINGITVTRNDKSYRTKVNATEGIKIQKNIGTQSSPNWSDRFFVDTNGNLNLKGYFQAGEGERVFTIDSNGLALGSSIWANAPFRADYHGNVYMNRLTADTAEIKNSYFRDGHIVGSDLTIGAGNQVFKVFPNIGIWAGNQNFNDAPFSVDLQGRMKLKNGNNEVFIDTVNNNMYLNKMNLIGAGVITGQQLIVHSVIAGEATINDLTVNHLKTMKKEANVGEIVDYQDIKDNFHKFITGTVASKSHAKADNGKPLYWVDANKKYQTFDVTPYPVDAYTFSDVQEKSVKTFLGSGADAKPFEIDGAGDGGAKVSIDGVEYESARAYKLKYNGGVVYRYLSSNYAKERKLSLADDGIYLKSEEEKINIDSKNLYANLSGELKITHDSGYKFEITNDSIVCTDPSGNFFKLQNGVLSASANEYNFA